MLEWRALAGGAAGALLPGRPRRFLKIVEAWGEYSNSASFFWDAVGGPPRPEEAFKTVEPKSAIELLALRFRIPQTSRRHPRRNGGSEVLWHFCADARRSLEEPLRKGPAFLFRFGQMRQIDLGLQKFQQSQTGSRKEGGSKAMGLFPF